MPELLAPAGNLAKLKTALLFGADAVYAGIPDFSLRVRINDFNLSSLAQGIDWCRKKNKKIYITVNIFAHNRHLQNLPSYIKQLKKMQPNALIVSDPGVLRLIKTIWPQAEIHLSTQANCTNWQAARFWFQQGVKRVILGREVSLEEIKEIKKRVPRLELEYFVHGAMCMAYSGRCFLSQYFVGRSANLGDCVQPCRWQYQLDNHPPHFVIIKEAKRPQQSLEIVEEEHGSYLLNSRDLCLIKYLDRLIDAGIDSFKIEGRAKSVYYQAVVVGAYRQALNIWQNKYLSAEQKRKKINYLFGELNRKLVHRGYTTGFLLGHKGEQNFDSSHLKSGWEFCGEVLSAKPFGKHFKIFMKVHNTIRQGDKIEILTPKYDIIKKRVGRIFNETQKKWVDSAHGGQNTIISFRISKRVAPGSVIRRKI